MKYAIALCLLIFAGILSNAHGTPPGCEKTSAAHERLSARHGEAQVAVGTLDDGLSILEVWVGPTGSWTLLETFPTGLACARAAGMEWRASLPAEDHIEKETH